MDFWFSTYIINLRRILNNVNSTIKHHSSIKCIDMYIWFMTYPAEINFLAPLPYQHQYMSMFFWPWLHVVDAPYWIYRTSDKGLLLMNIPTGPKSSVTTITLNNGFNRPNISLIIIWDNIFWIHVFNSDISAENGFNLKLLYLKIKSPPVQVTLPMAELGVSNVYLFPWQH